MGPRVLGFRRGLEWDQSNAVGGANDLKVGPWCGCGHGFKARALTWGALERQTSILSGRGLEGQSHKKQTRVVGLWAVAGSRLKRESLTHGVGGRGVDVGPTWMPILGHPGFGLWVWPRLRTVR